ncbi:MAG: hypothetical protein M1372_02745 [Patescibacteria group bacterium]|nr:hypothetical protein [Patescibacteria group bacterium]
MKKQHVIEQDTIFLLAVSIIAGVVFAAYFNHKPNIRFSFSLPSVQNFQKSASTSAPTPTLASLQKTETFSQVSPDGAKKLVMTVTTNKNKSKTYIFTASGETSATPSIYAMALPDKESMSIPFNTWSPDGAYVFIQHNTSSGSGVLVVKGNGQPFEGGQQYLDVSALFAAKNTGNIYQEATGWASETLLILNTTQPNGSKGSSYWFEAPSKGIIQLSTEF